MRIITNAQQKDYFDRHIKDGIDDSVALKRVKEFDKDVVKTHGRNLHSILDLHYKIDCDIDCYSQAFSIISVCGVPYVIRNTAKEVMEITGEKKFYFTKRFGFGIGSYRTFHVKSLVVTVSEFLNMLKNEALYSEHGRKIVISDDKISNWMTFLNGQQNRFYVELHKKLMSPVFLVGDYHYPKLSDYNFARIIDSQTMYQNIMQFMISMKSCNPPVELSNSERVVKAGFDLNRSFRHRRR